MATTIRGVITGRNNLIYSDQKPVLRRGPERPVRTFDGPGLEGGVWGR
jgi:hypothetical protein